MSSMGLRNMINAEDGPSHCHIFVFRYLSDGLRLAQTAYHSPIPHLYCMKAWSYCGEIQTAEQISSKNFGQKVSLSLTIFH